MKKIKNYRTQAVKLVALMETHAPVSEQFRALRTSLQFKLEECKRQSFVISSSAPGEGKSTVAANVAIMFALANYRTLFVDADLRKPAVAKSFNLNNAYGLSTLLIDDQLQSASVWQTTEIEQLKIITSGSKPSNPAELLGSPRMRKLLVEWENAFDIVILDMPPVLAVTDAQLIAPLTGGMVMVVREGIALKNDVKKASMILKNVNSSILGVVYNGSRKAATNSYAYYGT